MKSWMNRIGSTAAAGLLLLPLVAMAASLPPQGGGGRAPQGRWNGYIELIPGQEEVDFVVDFYRSGDDLRGVMSVPSQGVEDRELDEVSMKGSRVEFVYTDQVGASVLAGTVSDDGSRIEGIHRELGEENPFRMRYAGAAGGADEPPAPELVDLGSPEDLRRSFNEGKGSPRLILLLAPGCERCVEGARLVQRHVVAGAAGTGLKTFVVWVKVSETETRELAKSATWFANDPSVTHYWAPDLATARAFSSVLGLGKEPAWDVFLAYGPTRVWDGGPPAPDLYMHRRNDLPDERRLDALRMKTELETLLEPRADG